MGRFVDDVIATLTTLRRVPWLLPVALAVALVPTVAVALAGEPTSWLVHAVAAITVVCVGIPLTFVTPALALSTDRVRAAFRIGWRLLRSSGAEVPGHVLVPSVVLAGLVLASPVLGGLVTTLLYATVALVARGATTCRYAELVDVAWPDVPGSVWRRRVAVG